MEKSLLSDDHFLRRIFDVIPSSLLIVDDNVRVLHANAAASRMLGIAVPDAYMERTGDALHCMNAESTPEGCGYSQTCGSCVIRSSVTQAFGGNPVHRKRTIMNITSGNIGSELAMLVTASLFDHACKQYVLLILEDITELVQLRGFLPICASCKKIRDDKGYWNRLEQYISSHSDVTFTHGLCPDCAHKLYPEYFKNDS